MSDFHFSSPYVFTALWILPVIVFVAAFFNRQALSNLQKALGKKLLPYLMSSVSFNKRKWKLALEIAAVALAIVAYARPQSREGTQKIKNEGIEIVLLVDVSNSMLAEDVKPSRIELAKSELKRLIEMSTGDRFGIVAFAGSAVLLSPLTTDQDAIKMYVESLSPYAVSTQGTDFKRGLDEARAAFKRGGVDDESSGVTRAIIVVSDGEDNEKGAQETAEKLAEEGIFIFGLAVGTEKGAPLPMKDDRNEVRGYRRDQSGQVVISKTSGAILKDISQAGKGSFHHLTFQADVVSQVRQEIAKLQKSQFADGQIKTFKELYQPFLFLAIVLGLIEISLGERRRVGRIWKGRFEVLEQ